MVIFFKLFICDKIFNVIFLLEIEITSGQEPKLYISNFGSVAIYTSLF